MSKLLLVVALLLGVVGVGVAVVQPGDLGGSDTETAGPATTTSPTAVEDAPGTTSTTASDEVELTTSSSTTSAPSTTAAPSAIAPDGGTAATTTVPTGSSGAPGAGSAGGSPGGAGSGGSGLDGGSAGPSDLEDGLADTGGTPLLGAAVGLAALALALPRRRA